MVTQDHITVSGQIALNLCGPKRYNIVLNANGPVIYFKILPQPFIVSERKEKHPSALCEHNFEMSGFQYFSSACINFLTVKFN
jgi:hypothetical protein